MAGAYGRGVWQRYFGYHVCVTCIGDLPFEMKRNIPAGTASKLYLNKPQLSEDWQ